MVTFGDIAEYKREQQRSLQATCELFAWTSSTGISSIWFRRQLEKWWAEEGRTLICGDVSELHGEIAPDEDDVSDTEDWREDDAPEVTPAPKGML